MTPSRERASSVERTPEFEELIKNLKEFHEKRGTAFEEEPKIGQKHVDLLKLWNRVNELGGYDVVSDKNKTPLGWRNMGADLKLEKATHPSALAFMLKTVYYKNLAAYEIKALRNQEPPPKEILEDVSAKGGHLLTRTLENYPIARDEAEIDSTPKNDKMDVDDPNSTGRAGRGLRQAPPQRQLFQSDPHASTRQARHTTSQAHSPTPNYGMQNFHNATAAQALANYEPRQQYPLSLRPVTTPASNPELFKMRQAAIRDSRLAEMSKKPPPAKSNVMLPGTGFPGPNVYVRTWMALKSGVLEEQEYALHHLVKISHERGDKYRLDQFGGLLEALIDKLMETSSLFYDTTWELSYQQPDPDRPFNVLDALNGTSDMVKRLRAAKRRTGRDRIETDDMARRLKTINEAGLVTRNLVILEDNASYASKYPSMRDALTILLNLPDDSSITEVKHYALEIAEQLTRFLDLPPDDPLVSALMAATGSPDRGIILTSLRAITRIGTNLDHVSPLENVPNGVIERLCQWLLVGDSELSGASLDFLYRYTAGTENAELLLKHFDIEGLVRQLVRLLQHTSRHEEVRDTVSNSAPFPPPQPSNSQSIPRISQDHVEMLLTYDEPERSSQWLRACFEERHGGEITQIALWQAYQVPFTNYSSSRPLLPAKDFITNVSTTFTRASAQVISGDVPKFVIKGIKPREVPVDPKGKPFMKCRWVLSAEEAAQKLQSARDSAGPNVQLNEGDIPKVGEECKEFAQLPAKLWEHIITAHLDVNVNREPPPVSTPTTETTTPHTQAITYNFDASSHKKYTCRWAGCHRFSPNATHALHNDYPPDTGTTSAYQIGMHVKIHLPDSSALAYQRSKHNIDMSTSTVQDPLSAITRTWSSSNTFYEETSRGIDAIGLPLTAALILRNLARNIPKTRLAQDSDDGAVRFVQGVFAPVKQQLFYVLAYNKALGSYLTELMGLLDREE